MKNCTHCKYAEWKRTATGKLHPSGEGTCRYEVKMPRLPASKYWYGYTAPQPFGGYINRRVPLDKDCACFAWYKDRK
jgi:hypothetical protein